MEKKLAICIPTWKRPLTIEKVLTQEEPYLSDNGIDVHIYDSSPDDETLKVSRKFNEKFCNIYYHRVDERIPSNEKFFDICGEIAKTDYQYMWFIQDHLQFSQSACDHIVKQLDMNGDFYYLDILNSEYSSVIENDLKQFAVEYTWMMIRFGITILNVQTFLKDFNTEQAKEQWLKEKTYAFSHVGYILQRLSEMKDPRIIRMKFARESFLDISRSQHLSWEKEKLQFCLETWGSMIVNLPDYYNPVKGEILQNQDELFLSDTVLLMMKKNGSYTKDDYLTYEKWIKMTFPRRAEKFRQIALLPYDEAEKVCLGNVINEINEAKKNNTKIFIYGAGKHASEFADYLIKNRMEFYGFVVTKAEGNPKKLYDHNVYCAEDVLTDGALLVLLAVEKSQIDDIRNYINTFNNEQIKCISLADEIHGRENK